MYHRNSVLLVLSAVGIAGYHQPSALVRPGAVRLAARTSRAGPLLITFSAADDELDLFAPEPQLPQPGGAHQFFSSRPAAPASSFALLGRLRRNFSRVFSSVLATLLSTFFFGSPAFAAATAHTASNSAAVALPPAACVLAAGAGLSAVVFAVTRLMEKRREVAALAAEAEAEAAADADGAAPTILPDALLMASLRDRMLGLSKGGRGAESEDDDEGIGAIADDELDDEMRDIRGQRAGFPVDKEADRGSSTAVLEPPRPADNGADKDEWTRDDELAARAAPPPAQEEPRFADEATVALLEKLFNSGEAADKQ
jgi:hypothetical protein